MKVPEQSFDAAFRPLLASTIAAGATVAAVLGFVAEIWGKLPRPAEQIAAIAAQTALIVFVLLVALLGLAFVVGWMATARFRRTLNLIGVVMFAAGVFVVGRNISAALFYGRSAAVAPPDDVAILFATVALTALALTIWGVAALARARWLRGGGSGEGDPGDGPKN